MADNKGDNVILGSNDSFQGWDDYTVDGLAVGTNASYSPPVFEESPVTGFYTNQYQVGDQGWFTVHIKHGYRAGTNVYPHVHWMHDGVGNGKNVHWEISYSPAEGYSQKVFPALTSFEIVATPNPSTGMHQIDEATLAQSFNTNLEIDSIVLFRIKRVTNGGLDYDGKPFIVGIDVHFESDGRLTVERNYDSGWTKFGGN